MDTKKEKWTEEILNSTIGIQRAEVNPFLYGKITSKISLQSNINSARPLKGIPIQWIFALVLLVVFNGITLFQYSTNQKKEKKEYLYQQFSSEMNITTAYTY